MALGMGYWVNDLQSASATPAGSRPLGTGSNIGGRRTGYLSLIRIEAVKRGGPAQESPASAQTAVRGYTGAASSEPRRGRVAFRQTRHTEMAWTNENGL